MKIIGNNDWRHPLVRMRVGVATPIQMTLAAIGRWEPLTEKEKATLQTETLTLSGDRPPQKRLVYATPRDEYADVENILYTSQGIAAVNGRPIARYSLRPPSTLEILKAPLTEAVKSIPAGTIVETETPYTYGDWVGDYVLALISTDKIIEPLVLPNCLAKKHYVIRDVEALGINYIIADEPVLIEKARVIRKRTPSYYWGPEDVAAYRKSYKVTPPPAQEGSLIYFGRFGTISEASQRHYPSEEVARIVETLGGKVFDTREASPKKFDELAPEMETVIADQGSAVFGMMHSQTKTVIELAEDTWWHNANLFICKGSGVQNYAVIHIFNKDEAALRERIEEHMKEFGVPLKR